MFVLAVALCVRSFRVADEVSRRETQWDGIDLLTTTRSAMQSSRGVLRFTRLHARRFFLLERPESEEFRRAHPVGSTWQRGAGGSSSLWPSPGSEGWPLVGFAYGTTSPDVWRNGMFAHREDWVAVPLWLIALVAGLPPVTWVARLNVRRRRARVRDGLCRRCGYDLRASPARCPECGSPARADA